MFRIYIDESGTHDAEWLVIGALFVPDHGRLHSALCRAKDEIGYFNNSSKVKAHYKEIHLAKFKSSRDVAVAERWVQEFMSSSAYFRCIAVEWAQWDGRFFGDAFDTDALKKLKAYKKWLEMLLHPELKEPTGGQQIRNAELYLDRLKSIAGYDVLPGLRERFTRNYSGRTPYIHKFEYQDSTRDAAQCLQLCDLLTGCIYQAIKPAQSNEKRAARMALESALAPSVKRLDPGFWRGYASSTLREHFPKLSAWFWEPDEELNRNRRRMVGSTAR